MTDIQLSFRPSPVLRAIAGFPLPLYLALPESFV
jgi:hypothetical protein